MSGFIDLFSSIIGQINRHAPVKQTRNFLYGMSYNTKQIGILTTHILTLKIQQHIRLIYLSEFYSFIIVLTPNGDRKSSLNMH